MKLKNTILASAVLAIALPASSSAATIVWGASTNVSAITDVSKNGTLVFATNIGGGAVTVNGVAFAAGTQTGGGNVGSTNATTGVTNLWGAASFGGYGNSGQTGDYAELLTNGVYTNNDGSTHTHTLTNLTNGQLYEIQFWTSDTRAGDPTSTSPRVQEISDGVNSAVSMNSSTVGQYIIGTFTASGTDQVIAWKETGDVTNGATANAMQLRLVPEPSSAALLGLGGLALILRRRK